MTGQETLTKPQLALTVETMSTIEARQRAAIDAVRHPTNEMTRALEPYLSYMIEMSGLDLTDPNDQPLAGAA